MYIYLPSVEWLMSQMNLALQIIVTTIIASFLGNLIEERNWTGLVKIFALPVTRWAHLPAVSAAALLTSFFSMVSANSMLVSAFEDGRLNSLQLRVSAMCTSFMTYIYHNLKIIYPTLAALGIVAVWYFGLLIGIGLLVVIIALLIARFNGKKREYAEVKSMEQEVKEKETWKKSLKKVTKKTIRISKRITIVSIPMFLYFSFLSKVGVLEISDNLIPFESYRSYYPSQALAVVGTMLGGILSAATVGAGFIRSGELQNSQVLLALLTGNAISLPIRSIRRSLPAAMSIFPAKEAVRIVLLNQGSRLITNIVLVMLLIYLMSKGFI